MTKQSTEAKQKARELAEATILKQFGKEAISPKNTFPDMEFINAGCPSINMALGGGYVRGRIIEIYGPESSGKTTLTLHAIAEVQKAGGMAAFIDAEHALDPSYAVKLGVNTDDLLISQPDSGEQALGIVETLVASGAFDIIVVDSVAALVPQKELEGDMGDANVGIQARLMSQAMRKLTGIASRTGTTVFFINQLRMKIGVMFGNPETTTGGNALKFYASQRIDVRKKEPVKSGEELVGNNVKIKVVKNKVAPPHREAEFVIRYGEGIDVNTDILRLAVAKGLVTEANSRYKYNDKPVGHGEANAALEIKNNQELRVELLSKLS